MNNWLLILLAVIAAVASSVATTVFLPSAAEAGTTGRESASMSTSADLTELQGLLASIEERQTRIESSLAEVEMSPATAAPAREAVVHEEDLERIVARWMAENTELGGGGRGGAAVTEQRVELSSGVAGVPLDTLLDMLMDDELTEMERQDMWQKVRDDGRMDEVLEELEGLCEMEPNNPDLRVDLAEAYIQKIFDVGNGPLAGVYGSKADQAYDFALELDPTHWDARFNKAVALSNWPAFLGKTGEAIENFEILISQQADQPQQPHFAQSYLFLGNMYQQTGDAEKALQAWRNGAEMFPDDEALREQLRLADQ